MSEWIEETYPLGDDRVVRGGSFASYGPEYLHADSRFHSSASGGIGGGNGFRVASAIPEPSSVILATLALVGLIGFGLRQRRTS